MDSVTHIVLGAATGQVFLGSKVGSRAVFWGAIAGSIPDFDTFVTPLLSPASSVLFHRGPTHSILFALIIAPILGYIISAIHKDNNFRKWTMMGLVAILMHSVIDVFNTYGTELLFPFSNARLALDSIGIIDFTLLLPILTLLIVMMFKPKRSAARTKLATIILGYTLVFTIFTIGNKFIITNRVKKQLSEQNVSYTSLKTAPLPFTNLLWLALAEDSTGYHYGYISNLDTKPIHLKYIKRNANLLGDLIETDEVKKLMFFTDNYYAVQQNNENEIRFHDLRFGSMAFDSEDWYVFTFLISGNKDNFEVSRSKPERKFGWGTTEKYWQRIFRDLNERNNS